MAIKMHEHNYKESRVWIGLIIILGVLVRIFISISRCDLQWPDEQFQTLEPASRAVFGYGLQSWEWQTGYRPWILPGLYMPLFFLLKWIGITGGKDVILISRAYTAVFSGGAALFGMSRTLELLKVCGMSRVVSLALFSFSVPMVLWSCTTLGDNWAMLACWFILPELLERLGSRRARDWFLIGVFIGIPVLIKLQLAFWAVGVGISLVMIGTSIRLVGFAGLGGLVDLLFLGGVDALTWGKPFHSLLEQVFKGRAIGVLHGVSPWWEYFPKVFEDQRTVIELIAVLISLLVLSRTIRRSLYLNVISSSRKLIVIIFPMCLLFVAMLTIEHKETRFLLPIFPLLYLLIGFFLHSVFMNLSLENDAALMRDLRRVKAAMVLGLIGGAFWVAQQTHATGVYLTSMNIVDLEDAVYHERLLKPESRSCILLVNHNWAWTHGQLILGETVRILSKDLDELVPTEFDQCSHAVIQKSKEVDFQFLAGKRWERTTISQNNFVLYRQN